MTRLYVPSLSEDAKRVTLNKEDGHYLLDVLRYRSGDMVVVFDGRGREYKCKVTVDQRKIDLSVESSELVVNRPLKDIIYLQGMLKGQKMDLVIQKLAELGIVRLIPVITGRSQIKSSSKLPRWIKIAEEASRQCRRTDIMKVDGAMDLSGALGRITEEYPDAFKVVFYEGNGVPLSSLRERINSAAHVIFFVGPEGGFPEEEITQLETAGFVRVFLGGLVLRAETASIATAGIVQYLSGQFDVS